MADQTDNAQPLGGFRAILAPADYDAPAFASRNGLLCVAFFGLLTLVFDYFRYPELFESGTALFADQLGYYRSSRGADFLHTVFLPDFNYISLIPRTLSAIGEFLHMRPGEVGTFYAVSGSFLRGAFLGLITLNVFRKLIANDGLRWLAALVLITIGNEHVRFVYNIGYIQIIALILILVAAALGRGRTITVLLGMGCVLALTKILAAVTLPLQIVAVIRQRGSARMLALLMIAETIFNVGVAVSVRAANPNIADWLSDPTVPVMNRITLGLALPEIMIANFVGFSASHPFAIVGGALAIVTAFAAAIFARREALVPFALMIVTAFGYAVVSAYVVTALLNWPKIAAGGPLVYHVFPIYGLGLVLLMMTIDILLGALAKGASLAAPGILRPPLSRLGAVIPILIVAPLLYGSWKNLVEQPSFIFRAQATTDVWGSGWRAAETPDGRQFCIVTPYTFHAPYGEPWCRPLFSQPIQSRLVWSLKAQPDAPLVLDYTGKVTPTQKVMAVGVFARPLGGFDDMVRFEVLVNGQNIPGFGPFYREVKGSGQFLYFAFDAPTAGVQKVEIKTERPVSILADEKSGQPYQFVYGID